LLVTYLGPARRIRASATDDWVYQGQEIDLPDATISVLRAAGHRFSAADDNATVPEPDSAAFDVQTPEEPEAEPTEQGTTE
jgi:hypothetical protein